MTPRDLGLAAIDEQLDARDIARVVRREKGHRLGGLVARTGAAPDRDSPFVAAFRPTPSCDRNGSSHLM
jgi:hypothetical protein